MIKEFPVMCGPITRPVSHQNARAIKLDFDQITKQHCIELISQFRKHVANLVLFHTTALMISLLAKQLQSGSADF